MADDSTLQSPAPAESTTTVVETVKPVDPPSAGLHDMSAEERREFYASGKPPKKDPDAHADSSTAKPGDQADATASKTKKAASEPAAPAKDPKARNSEENRITELLADRKREAERADRAERTLDDLQKRFSDLEAKPKADAKPDSSTAADPSQPEWKKYRNLPGAPKLTDFDGDGEDALANFVDAKAHFIAKQLAQESIDTTLTARDKQSAEASELQREMETVINTAAARAEAEETADPTLRERIDPGLRKLVPARLLPEGTAVGPHHYAKDFIMFECERPVSLHAFYSTDEGRAEWNTMMSLSPRQMERTIIARELTLGPSSQAKPAEKVPAKTFTKAPAPPEKGGTKSGAVVDAADKAVQGGDFTAFMSAMDEKEGTSRRYGRR